MMRSMTSVAVVVCSTLAGCAQGGPGDEPFAAETIADAAADRRAEAGHAYDAGAAVDSADEVEADAAPVDAATPCTLTFQYGAPACNACMGASCCAADNACGKDPNCLSLVQCLAQCPPPGLDAGASDGGGTCEDACVRQYPPSAMQEVDAIGQCAQTSCGAQCM